MPPSRPLRRLVGALFVVVSFVAVAVLEAQVVVSDPAALTWFKTRSGDSIANDTVNHSVLLTEGQASGSTFITNFPSAAVAVGQKITATIGFTTGATLSTASNSFRFGLINNGGTPLAANINSNSSSAFTDDTGYILGLNFNGGAGQLYADASTVETAQLSGLTGWTTLAQTAAGTNAAFAASTPYTLVLTATRTATGYDFSTVLNGGSIANYTLTATHTTATSLASFTTLALYVNGGNGAVSALNITGLVISVDTAGPVAPAITSHPSPQTKVVGDSAAFTVGASGTAPLTYAWRKDTTPLDAVANPSAATATLSLSNVQLGDAGNYDCVVTNSVSSATSNAALLTVNASATPPTVTTQPTDQTVGVNTAATFSVGASGTAPFTYAWRKNTVAIDTVANPSAATATLTIANAQPGDAASYDCVVTNSAGFDTSAVATLIVITPPVIDVPPANLTVSSGGPANFSVTASGPGTLTYQWRKNAVNLGGATGTTYSIASTAWSDTGSYDVVVTNLGGSTTSAAAALTVNSAPVIVTPPATQSAMVGSSVTLAVTVGGTAPFTYQWRKGGNPIGGATGTSLTLTNVQLGDSGSYDVVVTNALGNATSAAATLSVSVGLPYSSFNLTGFATLGTGTTGGGVIPETDVAYRKCATALDFVTAIRDANKTAGAVKVIEITADLNLGWNELDAATKALTSVPIRSHAVPKLHPTLIASGVSVLDIVPKSGLTIFSANGATIKHVTLNIKGTSNIIVRNLRFDEMWEWDEATKGDYDSNDWDFMVLSNGGSVTNVWIDHCTFTKAYDGIADMKKGTQYVTFSWCKYVGDDGATNPNSPVRQQIAALEANKASYTFYNFLRTKGFSTEDIVQIIQGHDKAHLMGATELDAQNNVLSATFHHQWFSNIWDRCVPRLRGGQVHNYNIFVDDSVALVAKRLRDTRANAMSTTDRNTLNGTYSFNPFLNGSISTEGAALLVEKSFYQDCLTPLRNNQTDVSNATYTGKIKSVDTLYVMHNADGSTTTVRGDSTDAGNPMGPFQAAIIPFSWNTTDGSRPYPAPPMDDPANLPQILAAGAGAGTLTWSKDNWLKTSYTDTAPVILTSPSSQTIALNSTGSLSVVAVGPGPLVYQWRKGGVAIDSVANPSAATDTLILLNAQSSDAGSYDCVVTNPVGPATSNAATIAVTQSYAAWAAGYGLGAGSGGDDTDGDGLNNLAEYGLNLSPVVANSTGAPTLTNEAGLYVFRFTRPKWATGVTYTVQVSTDLAAWNASPAALVVESSTASTETLVVTLDASVPRRFARLLVTSP